MPAELIVALRPRSAALEPFFVAPAIILEVIAGKRQPQALPEHEVESRRGRSVQQIGMNVVNRVELANHRAAQRRSGAVPLENLAIGLDEVPGIAKRVDLA